MLDEKDLQAIAQLMDAKLAHQKQDIMSETKGLLAQQKQDIMSETKGLLAQQKQEILDDMEVMDTRINALEAMVKKLNREMEKLKRAQ